MSDPLAVPRIAPGTRRTAGTLAWLLAHASGFVTRTTPPNLFLTMGRQPALFRGWLRFAARLMPRGTLPRRETELVILRVAHLRHCTYEFEHHVRLAKREGIRAADVERIMQGPQADGWSARERALLAAVDALHAQHDMDDATWEELRRHLDEPAAIELLMLVGHYEMLATFIGTLRIEPDRPRR
jgi:AhpD family alkylhydroperoxidase